MAKEYLFIGGSKDGQCISVPEEGEQACIPKLGSALDPRDLDAAANFKSESYIRLTFAGPKKVQHLYAVKGLDYNDVFEKLCQGYSTRKGLKDHEIGMLVNSIRDEVAAITPVQCLRQLIVRAVTKTLTELKLRVDWND